jgi:hypothetical protein
MWSSLAIAVASFAVAALLWITGGFDVDVFGATIRSHDPLRPLLVGAVALTCWLLCGGMIPAAWLAAPRRLATSPLLRRVRSIHVAWALAVATSVIGVRHGTRAIGGADSYGYVSEADQWLTGHLRIDQSFALDAPWPQPEWTFSPLGYAPAPTDRRIIVPGYPPGLPLLLAAAKWLGGQDALFCVVPLTAGLLVLATYGIGRRLGSGITGAIAAWLVATSPPVLFMTITTMTDVPVAGVCAASVFLLLGTSAWSAAGAGLLSGLAILIRPNFLPLAAILGCLYLLRMRVPAERRRALGHAVLFALGVLPGIAATLIINARLYGSPLTFGNGMPALFTWSHLGPNFRNYMRSLVDTHTPVVLAGLVALAVPLRVFWPGVRDRSVFVVFGLFTFTIWLSFCAFNVLEEWWYLRYLLSCWPFIMLGVAAVSVALLRTSSPFVRTATALTIVTVGLIQLRVAADRYAFTAWQGERRFIVAAQLARRVMPENSVALSGPHAGSIRYYGGRMTMRYDQIDPAWFDRLVDWLTERGVHTYVVVEDWEVAEIRERFAGARRLAALAQPVAIYAEPGKLLIFDLSEPPPASAVPVMVTGSDTGTGWRAVGPAPPPHLVFRR